LVVSITDTTVVLVAVVSITDTTFVLDTRSIRNIVTVPALIGCFVSKDTSIAFIDVSSTPDGSITIDTSLQGTVAFPIGVFAITGLFTRKIRPCRQTGFLGQGDHHQQKKEQDGLHGWNPY
jgi:hypothetical protein